MGLRERERGEGVITLFCGEEDDDFLVEGVGGTYSRTTRGVAKGLMRERGGGGNYLILWRGR